MKSWLKWLLGIDALERDLDKLRFDLYAAENTARCAEAEIRELRRAAQAAAGRE